MTHSPAQLAFRFFEAMAAWRPPRRRRAEARTPSPSRAYSKPTPTPSRAPADGPLSLEETPELVAEWAERLANRPRASKALPIPTPRPEPTPWDALQGRDFGRAFVAAWSSGRWDRFFGDAADDD